MAQMRFRLPARREPLAMPCMAVPTALAAALLDRLPHLRHPAPLHHRHLHRAHRQAPPPAVTTTTLASC
jgi:hypothetical protein